MILPIDVMSYAKELQAYVDKVKLDLKAVKGDQTTVRLGELEKVVKRVQNAAKDVDREIESIRRTYSGERGHCKKKQWKELRKRVWKVNEKLRGFENGFIDEKGIKGREWYRNLVVARTLFSLSLFPLFSYRMSQYKVCTQLTPEQTMISHSWEIFRLRRHNTSRTNRIYYARSRS